MTDDSSDPRRRVNFINKQMDNTLSSSSSGPDDENDDPESNNLTNNSSSHLINNFTYSSNITGAHQSSSGSNGSNATGRKSKKRSHQWQMLEGYRDQIVKVNKPINYEGILLKRRNWPMKGWHKRYFILADGSLSYGKSKQDVRS
jgi:hypothetical protein